MNQIRILLLGVGGNVSQGILKAIRYSGLDCYIVGACVSADAVGLYLCDKSYISPYAASDDFLPWLYDICRRERVDILFSGVEEVIEAVSPVREDLRGATNAIFRASAPDQLAIGRDKLRTCRWLTDNGFPAPGCCASGDAAAARALMEKYGFPLIAKPRCGKSSSGVFQIDSEEALASAAALENYVIQECVGGPDQEYTIGCYRGLDGWSPPPVVMRRTLKDGASWRVEVVEDRAISEEAAQICGAFKPDGPLNIQLRLNRQGRPVPFEFNVRFSGTTPMRAQFGFQDVKAMLLESVYQQEIKSCFAIRQGLALRYTNELYVIDNTDVFTDGTGSKS